MKRNYNTVYWFYDHLARMVFGHAQANAQRHLLKAIAPGASILIIGGGTGWILEEITRLYPLGLHICYVDAASRMIAKARQRDVGGNEVVFMAQPVNEVVFDREYDTILTPFLFDNLNEEELQRLFVHVLPHISRNALWLWCDFRDTKVLWQQALLKSMYLFFGAFCGISAKRLPGIDACFKRHHFVATATDTFMYGFITSGIYRRV